MSASGNWDLFLESRRGLGKRKDDSTEVPAEPSAPASFRVSVLYQDFLNGREAVEIYKTLLERLGSDLKFDCRLWNFASVAEPRLFNASARETADAEMVIVSCQGNRALPEHIRNWLATVTSSSLEAPRALVVLMNKVDEAEARKSPDCQYLENLAKQAGMDFFLHANKAPRAFEEDTDVWLQADVRLEDGLGPRRNSGWGLND